MKFFAIETKNENPNLLIYSNELPFGVFVDPRSNALLKMARHDEVGNAIDNWDNQPFELSAMNRHLATVNTLSESQKEITLNWAQENGFIGAIEHAAKQMLWELQIEYEQIWASIHWRTEQHTGLYPPEFPEDEDRAARCSTLIREFYTA
jgi:hypothetical protein